MDLKKEGEPVATTHIRNVGSNSVEQDMAMMIVEDKVLDLLRYAASKGVFITIERVSVEPFAMGKHKPVVKVWPNQRFGK